MEERFDIKSCKVFDAKDMVLGRIASIAAKSLLNGESIAIVNAEQAVITGKKASIAAKYKTRLNLQEKENPEHSPYWSRRPDLLFKRIVRGMLPYRKPRGKEAYRRLHVYMGVPDELAGVKPASISIKDPKTVYAGYIRLKDLSKNLGYKVNK
ncbi:50S ribosomal protein L13 [Candidatus Marsarchaeota archaeon]|nr:50S ribosomal protein L13 [Candidatus Marsarchaeota archaeon]MCL5405077.1 50S ribosomal protein L13 [Candidatus Marsarchaeota archaeon]